MQQRQGCGCIFLMAIVVLPLCAADVRGLPFSWDSLATMRYTFCNVPGSNTSLLSPADAKWVSQQPVFLQGVPTKYPAEDALVAQAQQLRALNPKQKQWAYFAIDWVRPVYRSSQELAHHPECLLRDANGKLVRSSASGAGMYVYGFDTECGVARWLDALNNTVITGGFDGLFIDGFQGCDPWGRGVSCGRICSGFHCNSTQLEKWNQGLKDAIQRLKRDILGLNRTLIVNQTPGPFTCDSPTPSKDCPFDGTNFERYYGGLGEISKLKSIASIDHSDAPYPVLVHIPHANDIVRFNKSIAAFLVAADEYMYHGSGFGYDCSTDGWLDRSLDPVYNAKLGAPNGIATETDGCDPKAQGGVCVMARNFTSGTKVWINVTDGSSCVQWAEGWETPAAGKAVKDGCSAARAWGQR